MPSGQMRKFFGEQRHHLTRGRRGECRPQEGSQRNQGAPSVQSPSSNARTPGANCQRGRSSILPTLSVNRPISEGSAGRLWQRRRAEPLFVPSDADREHLGTCHLPDLLDLRARIANHLGNRAEAMKIGLYLSMAPSPASVATLITRRITFLGTRQRDGGCILYHRGPR